MSEDSKEGPQQAPVDGPDPGGADADSGDLGASSQGAPGGRVSESGEQGEQAADPAPNPQDSNERADERATVVEPD